MSRFSPIAIVGRACVLPGALSPEELGDAVMAGRDLLSSAPAGRWSVGRDDVLCAPPGTPGVPCTGDRAWSDRGGYVSGFEDRWDPTGFQVPAAELDGLDPLFLWTLHTARAALAGCRRGDGARVEAFFGNLGFPAERMSRFAEQAWLPGLVPPAALAALGVAHAGLGAVDPRNRFMMSGPAGLLTRALGLRDALALDAACASSLYAVKLACDRLHDRQVDIALAGAVNRADDLFIHVGFCALSAMSRTGQSRPFHVDADGLVPAEGAGFLALKRLEDALADGDVVHGVIRGVGLSNDGRGRNLLAPAVEGQVRAMQAAWEVAGLDPASVGLLECHATGTPVGDKVELESLAAVFGGARELALGSLKSNLGHLVTAAGVAGIIKVTEAMRRGQRPPTLHAEQPLPQLTGGAFRPVQAAEEWPGPRRAAVSAFGFGGNNAHVVLDQLPEPGWQPAPAAVRPPPAEDEDLAVVSIGAVVGAAADAASWAARLASGEGVVRAGEGRTDAVRLALPGLRFPPNDLQGALPQQLTVLAAAREALDRLGRPLPRERTSALVGMEADPEVARFGLRWRLAGWARLWGAPAAWLQPAREGVVPELNSASVVGTMPNIPANRLNAQLDVAGPSFVLAQGERSGLAALRIAARALREGELDAAVIGAVDLSCEPAHQAAARAVLPADRQALGDAAVVLVLKRRADAEAQGDPILAVIPGRAPAAVDLRLGLDPGCTSLLPGHGHAFAAAGMVHLGAAVLSLATGARPDGGSGPARAARVEVDGEVVHLLAPPAPVALPPHALATPALTLPAHWPPITLPRLSAPRPAPRPEVALPAPAGPPVQTMAPAPSLPPVLGAPAVDLRPPLQAAAPPQVAAPPQAPSTVLSATIPAPTPHLAAGSWAPAPAATPAGLVQEQVAMLRQAHERYLADQAALHDRFLQVRQHAMFALLGAGPQAGAAAVSAPPPLAVAPPPLAVAPPPLPVAPPSLAVAPPPLAPKPV
ncbi:3-hydroxyacyl-[acyl-carrier-protein] dehydratase FabA, partial [Myxococcota bacterium]|nr:3-hydroxyacyl-[acyl-carrier-protein] dehydratase FabA [Myxococcota bacterium]